MSRSWIVIGTEVGGHGGIAQSIGNWVPALRAAGHAVRVVPSHVIDARPVQLRTLGRAVATLRRPQPTMTTPIAIGHAGGPLSIAREAALLRVARARGAATLLAIHGDETVALLGSRLGRRVLQLALRDVDGLVALTPWWKEQLLPIAAGRPVFVWPNPLPQAASSTPLTSSTRRRRLLTCTRLVAGKNVDAVIRALRFLPGDTELCIAGTGPELETLRELARPWGRRVRFLGWVSGVEKVRAFTQADAFVLPSTYDSFGMGFIEALNHGLPVVAANWRAIPDVLPPAPMAQVVPLPLDPRAIARAVLAALNEAPSPREIQAWAQSSYGGSVVAQRAVAEVDAWLDQRRAS